MVLAGANPGAFIDSIICHGDSSESKTIIYNDSEEIIIHSNEDDDPEATPEATPELEHSDSGKTLKQIYDTLNDEQKNLVDGIVGEALTHSNQEDNEDPKGGETMKHNVFDATQNGEQKVLSHSDMAQLS